MKSMSAASKPAARSQRRSTRKPDPVAGLPGRNRNLPQGKVRSLASQPTPANPTRLQPVPSVRQLPAGRSLPVWLRWLMRAQRGSVIVAFGLIVAMLVVYGSTVYTQQLWSQEYGRLKRMQRHERQAIAANESLKAQLAAQAERPESGLVPKSINSMVIVPASPQRLPRVVAPAAPKLQPAPDRPLGY